MPTDLENLTARRSAITAELAGLKPAAAGGKPNSKQGGIDHVGYKDSLYRELEEINGLIGELSGPFEIFVQGVS